MDKIYLKLLANFAKENKERITPETVIAFEFYFLKSRIDQLLTAKDDSDINKKVNALVERCEKNIGFFLTNPEKVKDIIKEASVIP